MAPLIQTALVPRDRLYPFLPPRLSFLNCFLFQIKGGVFAHNKADFGGFLYKKGVGDTSCSGAVIEQHTGVDGGAIYALDDAKLEWECDLLKNTAVAGPAM